MLGIYLQSKENKKKQRAVYFRIRTSSGSFTISTGMRATVKQWNRKTQKLKPLSEFECMLNVKLTHQREAIEKSLTLYRAEVISYPELKRQCLGKTSSGGVLELLSEYSKEKAPKTVEAYRVPLNKLSVESIEEINYNTITKAIASWKGNLSPTSINTYVRHLISFRNDAYRRGIVSSPIVRERTYRQRVKELEIKSITSNVFKDAIDKANTDIEFTSLRMYLLSFIGRGLYYGDFMTLNPTSGVFTHYRQKTGNRMLIDGLDGLIERLHSTIPLSHLNTNKIRKYQESTKRLLGAPFKTARKTFDSYALLVDTDFQIRLHLLGQRDNTIKRHYTNFEWELIQDKVNKAHRKVVNKFNAVEYAERLLDKL